MKTKTKTRNAEPAIPTTPAMPPYTLSLGLRTLSRDVYNLLEMPLHAEHVYDCLTRFWEEVDAAIPTITDEAYCGFLCGTAMVVDGSAQTLAWSFGEQDEPNTSVLKMIEVALFKLSQDALQFMSEDAGHQAA